METTFDINPIFGLVSPEVYEKYTDYLTRHIKYVQEYSRKFGVNEEQLAKHDASKYSKLEFVSYANYFYGNKEDWLDDYELAWLHHLKFNPHHWNYWVLYPNTKEEGSSSLQIGKKLNVIEMPEMYVREMLADWMGAGKAITGSEDIEEWIVDNYTNILLHPNSIQNLNNLMVEQHFSKAVCSLDFTEAYKNAI